MAKKKQLRIEIKPAISHSPGTQWYFRIVAKNGQVLAHSEVYERKTGATNAAKSLIKGITEVFSAVSGFRPGELSVKETFDSLIKHIENEQKDK